MTLAFTLPDKATGRTLSVAGVLLAEYLLMYLGLSFLHAGEPFALLPELWQSVLAQMGFMVVGAIAAFCAAIVLWGGALRSHLAMISVDLGAWRPLWLILHVITLVFFAGILFALTTGQMGDMAEGAGVLLFWLASAGLLTFALVKAAFGHTLSALFRRIGVIALSACLFGALAAYSAILVFPYWELLAAPTLKLSAGLLQLCCEGVVVDEPANAFTGGDYTATLGLNDFVVEIWASCSGIEGMALVAVFLTGYLIRFREDHRFPRALILIPLGMCLSFLANGLRVALLVVIGAYISPELAIGAFHSKAGWIFFCALTIGIIALSRQIPWFQKRDRVEAVRTSVEGTENPTAGYLLPFLVWLAIGLLASALTIGLDVFYVLRVVVVVGVLVAYRDMYAREGVMGPGIPSESGPLLHALSPWLIGIAVFLMWLLLHPEPVSAGDDVINPFELGAGWPVALLYGWIVFRLIGTSLIVPVIEELAFRGYLQRRFISADFTAVPQAQWNSIAVFGSALVFGVLHQNWLAGALAGIAFSLAAHIRGRLSDAMIAHGFTNALLSLWVLAFGRWDLW